MTEQEGLGSLLIQDTRKYQATVHRLEANHRRTIEMQIYFAKKHDRSITQKQIVLKTMTTTFLSLKKKFRKT